MMKCSNQRGTTSMGEYALLIFLVMGTVLAMTTYVKRGFQGRMHDARHLMITTASDACDANCMKASGRNGKNEIPEQYEPYYAAVIAEVNADSLKVKTTTPSIDSKIRTRSKTEVDSESNQAPPRAAVSN